jgi:Flp pilus assembly protein TadG
MTNQPSRVSVAAWRRLRSLRRRETGAAVVEFALVAPVLFLVVFAVIDFGRALWIQNVLVSAVREGARYGASKQNTTAAQDSAAYQAACYITRVLYSGTCSTANNGNNMSYARSNIGAAYDGTTGLITVQITNGFTYSPITPYAARLGLGSLTFRPVANFRWEQAS